MSEAYTECQVYSAESFHNKLLTTHVFMFTTERLELKTKRRLIRSQSIQSIIRHRPVSLHRYDLFLLKVGTIQKSYGLLNSGDIYLSSYDLIVWSVEKYPH